MQQFTRKRLTALISILALTLGLGTFAAFTFTHAAPPPTLSIFGNAGNVPCGTTPVAAFFPNGALKLSIQGYGAQEQIQLYFTFPDGRRLDLPAVVAAGGLLNTVNTSRSFIPADEGGEALLVFKVGTLPIGCYTLTTVGLSNNQQATIMIYIGGSGVSGVPPTVNPTASGGKDDGGSSIPTVSIPTGGGGKGDASSAGGAGGPTAAPATTTVPSTTHSTSAPTAAPATTTVPSTTHSTSAPTAAPVSTAVPNSTPSPTAPTVVLVPTVAVPSTDLTVVTDAGMTEGEPNVSVNISGRGFLANEEIALSVVMPDGVVMNLAPSPSTSTSGGFTIRFSFSQDRQIGTYLFTATGRNSNFAASAGFTLLTPAPLPTAEAMLKVLVAPDPTNPASNVYRIEIQGTLFNANEGVTLLITEPATAKQRIFSVAPQRTNAQGKFATAIALDATYPRGTYRVTAQGANGTNAIAQFDLPIVPISPGNP